MANEGQHNKRRFGLGFRINSVITVLLLVLLAIAVFSYRSLQDLSDQVNIFSSETLPALSNTINLTASLEETVHGTERLMNSNAQASRRIAFEETSSSLKVLRASLDSNQNLADTEELSTIIDILSTTTVDLNKLIEERIAQSAKLQNTNALINDWVSTDLSTPNLDKLAGINSDYLEWFGNLRQMVIGAGRIAGEDSVRDQGRIIRTTNRQLSSLENSLTSLDSYFQDIARKQLDGFRAHYIEPGGLFETQRALSSITARSRALARQMRVLVEELLRKTERLAASNSAQAQTATGALADKIEEQASLLLFGVVLACAIALLSYVFIEKQVIQRLMSLRTAVIDRASGGQKPVPADGHDEVTDIGKAVQFFIREIDGRQAQLQANAQQLQSVIRLSPQAMCIATREHMLYFNEAYIDVWNKLNPGVPFDVKRAHASIPKKLLRRTAKGSTNTISRHPINGQGGVIHWFDLASSDVEWQGTPARQIIGVDVTQQVQVEHTLEEARRKAEAAAQSKSNFLAMMSHEIRSPMNGIISVGEILEGSKLNKEQRELVQVINQSAETLLTILNDILDLSKIEADKLDIVKEDVDLTATVKGVANLLATGFKQKGVALNVDFNSDVPTHIYSDTNRIRQILFNLLGNALKFTEKGSVDLTVSRIVKQNSMTSNEGEVARNNDAINITITDTGIGISPEAIDRLFQPFEQADSTTARQFGGTGLGLSICKRLAELLGGQIILESTPGKGSSFTLQLPSHSETDHQTSSPVQEAVSSDSYDTTEQNTKNILVVEDNKINQLVIGKILKTLGHKWDTADNGLNALQLYDPNIYDLILTDLRMPQMDGFALARTIRSDETNDTRIPIVALSADAMDETRQLCKQAGIDAFLTKPVKVEDVKACLNSF